MLQNQTRCPHCGCNLILMQTASAPPVSGQWHKMSNFQNVSTSPFQQPIAPAAGDDWQRVTPVGRLTPLDVTTSLYDAGVSFVLVSIGAGCLCWYFDWPLIIPPACGFTAACWRYFGGMNLARNLLEIVESITRSDLNQDGFVGKPEPPAPIPLEVTHKTEAGIIQKMFRFDLPPGVTEAGFIKWVRGVLSMPDLTQARWVSSNIFTREAYVDLLDKLLEAGIIARTGKTKNAGFELTPAGLRALRRYLLAIGDTHSHSLTRYSAEIDHTPPGGEERIIE